MFYLISLLNQNKVDPRGAKITMSIENVELMHECFQENLGMER